MNINVEKCDACGAVNTAEPRVKWAAVASAGPRRIVLHYCPSCESKVTVKDLIPKLNPPLPVRPVRPGVKPQGKPVPVVGRKPIAPDNGPVKQTQALP